MTGRRRAANRVAEFVRAWRRAPVSGRILATVAEVDRLIDDLDALSKPRQVIRTVPQLQALAVGTKLVVQGDRAAQVEAAELWDLDTGAEIEAKRLLYVGTDLYDNLLPDPDQQERDTLRRMLPAIVIDPLD